MTGMTRFNIPLLARLWRIGKLKQKDVEFLEENNICYVFRHNGEIVNLLPPIRHVNYESDYIEETA